MSSQIPRVGRLIRRLGRDVVRSGVSLAVSDLAALAAHTARSMRGLEMAFPPAASARRFRLRGAPPVYLRRGAAMDHFVFHEIFSEGAYEPPSAVAAILGSPRLIVDLGGNIGLFGAFAHARWSPDSLISFEPDPQNLPLIRACAAHRPGWTVAPSAAGAADGTMSFAGGRGGTSQVALDGAGSLEVQVRDVLWLMGEADLVKMDIEGGEWPILADPRFRDAGPRVLVMEYHRHGCPDDDAREAVGEILAGAGYTITWMADAEREVGTLWAVRR